MPKDQSFAAGTRLDRWWKPKASSLLALLYLVVLLLTDLTFMQVLYLFLLSVVTILGIGSFGHFVNDYFDRDADRQAGKTNAMDKLKPGQQWGVIAASLGLALLPWLFLPANNYSIVLLTVEFCLLVIYAMPPFRLKERTTWPIFVDSAYAYAIPSVLAAYTFFLASSSKPNYYMLVCLFVWQMALGIRHYLNHLAADRSNDILTGTATLATKNGNSFIARLIRFVILPIEVFAFLAFLLVIGLNRPVFSIVIIVTWLLYLSIPLLVTLGRRYSLFSYRFSNSSLDIFYQNIWPLVPLVFLVISDWRYWFLLVVHLVIINRFLQLIKRVAPFLRYLFYLPLAPFYPGFLNKKKSSSGKSIVTPQPPVNIAVVNINRAKYTETFINGLLPRLKYKIFYLYGGELPTLDHEDRYFLTRWKGLHVLAEFLEELFNMESHYFLKQSISSYLQSRKIKLVLAEFGPVGAQLFPLSRDAGIPLLVWFHGYDVYHESTVSQHSNVYPGLFKEARKIIGVSEQMLQRLQQLGAPAEKLVHLPAFVNLELFPYRNRSGFEPNFLAVGRFAETKSPHLTILAFSWVVQKIPGAKLTLVGRGGGGELFEACLILVKSLGLEDSVFFRGVLSHNEVSAEMQRARVFVQHSIISPVHKDREGKPVAIMEAMACGLPVVATRHSGILELIEENVTGLLVDEYDIDAMGEAMFLLATDDERVQQIGWNASERIRQDPLIRDHVRLLESLIDECIA